MTTTTEPVVRRKKKVFSVSDGKMAEKKNSVIQAKIRKKSEKEEVQQVKPASAPEKKAEQQKKKTSVKASKPKPTEAEIKARKVRQAAKRVKRVSTLAELWPEVFCHPPRPLSIGLTKVLFKEKPEGVGQYFIGKAVKSWCMEKSYLEAAAQDGSQRYDFQGNVTEPLLDKHRAFARKSLESGRYWSLEEAIDLMKQEPEPQNEKNAVPEK